MIHFVTGNPGGGKGLYAMQRILDELVNGDRPVLTNLPVRIEPWVRHSRFAGRRRISLELGLREYLLQTYGRDFDVRKRLHILPEEEVPDFYLWRVRDGQPFKLPVTRRESGRVEEYDTTDAVKNGGVVYVTDEAWRYWNARRWQYTGLGLLFYAAQHRHLGDTWYVVTQKTSQIDKAMHRVAQDFAVVKNHGKVPFGLFKRPAFFQVSLYDEPPSGQRLKAVQTKIFKLDAKGIGSCYDTAAGSGIGGGSGADLNEKPKGFSWVWLLIGLVILVFVVSRAPSWLGRIASRGLGPARDDPPEVQPVAGASVVRGDFAHEHPVGVTNSAEIYVTGLAVFGGNGFVTLSDGRTVDVRSGAVTRLNRLGAEVDGRWYSRLPSGDVERRLALSEKRPDPPPVEVPVWLDNAPAPSVLTVIGGREYRSRPVERDYGAAR